MLADNAVEGRVSALYNAHGTPVNCMLWLVLMQMSGCQLGEANDAALSWVYSTCTALTPLLDIAEQHVSPICSNVGWQ